MAIANPSWTVIHKMKVAGLTGTIGGDWIFMTVGDAMQFCLSSKRDNV
jgi:sulfate transporter 2, low-affinity